MTQGNRIYNHRDGRVVLNIRCDQWRKESRCDLSHVIMHERAGEMDLQMRFISVRQREMETARHLRQNLFERKRATEGERRGMNDGQQVSRPRLRSQLGEKRR